MSTLKELLFLTEACYTEYIQNEIEIFSLTCKLQEEGLTPSEKLTLDFLTAENANAINHNPYLKWRIKHNDAFNDIVQFLEKSRSDRTNK